MKPYSYSKQFRTIVFLEIIIICALIGGSYSLWSIYCNGQINTCLQQLDYRLFLLLSFFRPFLLAPASMFFMMASNTYGVFAGILIGSASAILSSVLLFLLGKQLGRKLIHPWLDTNLPQTLTFAKTQDWKILLIARLVHILPFDLITFCAGVVDFRFRSLVVATIISVIPEIAILSLLNWDLFPLDLGYFSAVGILGSICLIPLFITEYFKRKQGNSLWFRLGAMYKELQREVRLNNRIIERQTHNRNKIPVLLIYGFFSTRRSITILERVLTYRGYEVFSFNLGGVLGVFFTKGIIETAKFIDEKLQVFFKRRDTRDIYIVAHSKGGLVALWWLLKLGGHKYCKKVITMGTPFHGTFIAWLLLLTPIGLIWRDLWQMRPGSNFLKVLHTTPIPDNVRIYNLYSNKDNYVFGEKGILMPPNFNPFLVFLSI